MNWKLFFPAVLLWFGMACNSTELAKDFKVHVTARNVPAGTMVKLVQLPFDGTQPLIIDTGRLGADGTVILSGSGKEESLYRLELNQNPQGGILLVNDGTLIEVLLKKDSQRTPTISGSPGSSALYELFSTYADKDSIIRSNMEQMDQLMQMPGNDSLMVIFKKQNEALISGMKTTLSDFRKEQENPVLDFYALMMERQLMDGKEWNEKASLFNREHPDHAAAKEVKRLIAENNARPGEAGEAPYALLDQQAPELNLPDASGNTIYLTRFRGKYLLIDFWASWCGPCREENPNVVAAYQNYRDKNFDILGVSLDKEWKSWQEAVKSDSLKWTQVSDLKFWNSSAVQLYQFSSIPFNVLLDPQGKIIDANLRGPQLQQRLSQLMDKQ